MTAKKLITNENGAIAWLTLLHILYNAYSKILQCIVTIFGVQPCSYHF